VGKGGQKFILHASFLTKLNDEGFSFIQEVPHSVLIAACFQRDSDDGREGSHVNRSL
jgi:hypothetical protein